MKKHIVSCVAFACALAVLSCSPKIIKLAHTGDTAQVLLQNQQKFEAELLAVNDSSIYVYVQPQAVKSQVIDRAKIYEIFIHDLNSVKIKSYSNKKWQGSIVAFVVIPSLILSITAASSGGAEFGSVMAPLSIPILLNFLLFSATTPPPPGVQEPISPEHLAELQKYARFPQGLTVDQLNQLLAINNQSRVEYFK